MKKRKSKFFAEFKAFITKGNAIDLAVGMIIGAAFTAIVNGLVNNIFKPMINAIPLGNMTGLITMLVPKDATGAVVAAGSAAIDLSKSIYIDWGSFIMAIINFFITALVLFLVIKAINAFRNGFGKVKSDLNDSISEFSSERYKELRKQGFTHKQIKELEKEEAEKLAEEKRISEEQAKVEEEKKKALEAELNPTTEELLKQILAELKKRDEQAQ